MCEVPCALLLSLGCLGVQGQSHLSELPGFHQWRASLTAHARAEQRLEAGPAPAETAGEQSSLQGEQSSLRGEPAQAARDVGRARPKLPIRCAAGLRDRAAAMSTGGGP